MCKKAKCKITLTKLTSLMSSEANRYDYLKWPVETFVSDYKVNPAPLGF